MFQLIRQQTTLQYISASVNSARIYNTVFSFNDSNLAKAEQTFTTRLQFSEIIENFHKMLCPRKDRVHQYNSTCRSKRRISYPYLYGDVINKAKTNQIWHL